jgi:hypothetical protein
MQDKIDRVIKALYESLRSVNKKEMAHPDEESLVCFLENKLPSGEAESIKEHLIICDSCAEVAAMHIKLKPDEAKDIPEVLLRRAKDLVSQDAKQEILEIFLKLKEKALELLGTTGDILVGQEFMPAPVLRSRNITDFKEEITILKDFKDIRAEAKIENRKGKLFSLTIIVREKATQKVMKDLRITLIKNDIELESYLTDSGRATFEDVVLGRYTVEISSIDNKLASILLDIKV